MAFTPIIRAMPESKRFFQLTPSLTGIDLDSKTELSAEIEIYNGQDKTVAGVDLDSEADWNAALTKNVSRCKNLDNLFVIVGTYFFLAGKPCTTTS